MSQSSLIGSVGQKWLGRDKCVKREGDGSCGIGDEIEGPVRQKVRRRNGSRLNPKVTPPMGEEEEDLVFLCVSTEVGT